jgi:hypothetical protein
MRPTRSDPRHAPGNDVSRHAKRPGSRRLRGAGPQEPSTAIAQALRLEAAAWLALFTGAGALAWAVGGRAWTVLAGLLVGAIITAVRLRDVRMLAPRLHAPSLRPRVAAPDARSPALGLPGALARGARVKAWLATILLVAPAALVVRGSGLSTSYELFVDEVVYGSLARSVADHGTLELFGEPFFTHPPLLFLLCGAVVRVAHLGSLAPVELVQALRWVNVVLGSVGALLLAAILARVTRTRRWAAAGGAFLVVEPFIARFDSRLLLETLTAVWLLAGVLALAWLADEEHASRRRRTRLALGAGTAFGLALLTKEYVLPILVVLLGWCAVRGEPIGRREAGVASLTAVAVYLPYPLVALVEGEGGAYLDAKLGGLLRLVGVHQITGFNMENSPSLMSRLAANADLYAASYLTIGLSAGGTLLLLARRERLERLVGLWSAASFAFLGYEILLGSLEEQMFYVLVIPAVAVLVTIAGRAELRRGNRPAVALAALAFLVVAFAFNAAAWVRVRTARDDAIPRTLAWVEREVPPGSTVAPLVEPMEFLLPRYALSMAGTPAGLGAARVEYVITSSELVEQGYGVARPSLIAWLRRHGRVAHVETGRSSGQVTVWELP